jgi:hypothetical protein
MKASEFSVLPSTAQGEKALTTQPDLRFPRRAAENPSFRGIMAANEQVWTPGQD